MLARKKLLNMTILWPICKLKIYINSVVMCPWGDKVYVRSSKLARMFDFIIAMNH